VLLALCTKFVHRRKIEILLNSLTKILILFAAILFCAAASGCTTSTRYRPARSSSIDIANNTININTAAAEDIEKLPGIGDVLARRIVEFRDKHGNFRRAEHLMLVEGMSEKRFRELQTLVRVE
jgi:competence ComEA-like helix-hairpin-helix protein